MMLVDYVGVAGASPDPAGRTDVVYQGQHGTVGGNGSLLINEATSTKDFADGAASTMIIAEQSGLVAGQ